MSAVLLPQSNLVVLLDMAGEGRAALHQLGIVALGNLSAGRGQLAERLSSAQGFDDSVLATVIEVVKAIDRAASRLELSTQLPESDALIAFIAGADTGVILVTPAGLLVRGAPTSQVPDVVLEMLEAAQRESADWALSHWHRDELLAAVRMFEGSLEWFATNETRRARLQDRAADLAALVSEVITSND